MWKIAKIMKIIFGASLQCLLILMLIPYCFASSYVTIATTEYPPYTGQFLVKKGFVNHIISSAFKQENIDVRFVFVPWSRAMQKTQDGTFDAASYASYREARSQNFIHSELLIKEKVFLFGLKNRVPKTWHSLIDLSHFRVGVTRGYSYSKLFLALMEISEHQPSVVNTDLQNFKMLMLQRTDLFPMEEFGARYLLNQHFSKEQISNIQMLLPLMNESSMHLLFSKKNPKSKKLMKTFNRGLATLKSSGKFATFEHQFKNGFYSRVKKID
jgi:polar amino acid transport system substrate-binding protein